MAKELFVYSPYKIKFKEQVSSGAVDDSQIGIIAETGELWVKGTYLPIVDLSKKADISKGVITADGIKDSTDTTFFTPNRGLDPNTTLATQKYVAEATTNFAKDLTGVIEATAEEFTYRPSAGNRSIRDASAVIRSIKGNTVVFAQLADLRSDLHREGDWSITPEVTTNTWGGFSKAVQVIAGHKYLFYINKKDGRSITDTYTLLKDTHRVDFNTPLFITSTETASWRWTALYKTSINGLRFQPQAFDLTRLFGAGNEPTTFEEFKSKFPDSYYPYSEPEVRNVITNQITTIGFNAYNGEYAEVIGGQAYYLGGTISTAYFTTEKGGETTEITIDSEGIYTPPANGYIYATGNDICINLSHSGVRNGEYEPYKRNIRLLPEIYKYFPDGMNGNANVWDEINAESAIKRWGVVDLGSLTWVKGATGTSGVYRWLGKGIEHLVVKTVAASDIPNIVCAKYILSSASNIWATTMPMQVSLDPTGSVLIYDSGYNAGSTTTADFTAHLQGVLLYYELAEPIVTPITEPIQLDYVVDDFGTEKASAFGNSAPFRADIVYQFNAEGRIRDNSRNIERIENTITDRLIPSQTAMLGLPNKVMTWNGRSAMMSLPIAESIAEWEMEEHPYEAIPTGKQVKDYISSITNRLIPSQSAMLGLPNKVMIWNGSTAMMSLPIAEDIDHWDLEESKLGTIPTSQQVREYIKSITDNLTPSQSATLESSNRVMVWNGDYAMTSLPIAANFAQWGAGAIPTGQQVIDYIGIIKGSLATGLTPKETLTIDANGMYLISANKAYEVKTASNTNYNADLYIVTTNGVDAAADNEWRIRIDARTGFGADINIEPLESGYTIRWAYPEATGVGTAPTITAGFIWDIQLRMIGKTLLGSYKKY